MSEIIMRLTGQSAESIWRKHKIYKPEHFFQGLGDTGELIEIEPGVKIWSNLSNTEKPKMTKRILD